MSLLLDALNRASKDKAAASSHAVAQDQAARIVSVAPVAAELRLEPVLAATPTAHAAASTPLALELLLSPPEAAPTSASAPSVDAWHTELEVAAAAPSQVLLPINTPVAAARSHDAPVPPAVSTNTAAAISAPASTASRERVAGPSLGAARVAQEIVRAKAPSARARVPRRVLVLGLVALTLSLGLGSVLWGWWGDPTAWLQTAGVRAPIAASPGATGALPDGRVAATSVSAPAAPVAPVAVAAGEQAAVAIAAPTERGYAVSVSPPAAKAARAAATVPKAPEASGTGVTAPDGAAPRDPCALDASSPDCGAPTPPKSGSPSKSAASVAPVFQSRSADFSALEQGYGALVQGRLGEAAQAYGRALANNPQERDALLGLAYIAQRQGREEEARGYYHQVLRHEPGNPVARAGLLSLGAAADPQLTISRAREVAEQYPDSAAAQATLGAALARVGRLADAQLAFQRAHAI